MVSTYVNCFTLSLHSHNEKVAHSYNTSVVLPQLLLAESKRRIIRRLQVSTICDKDHQDAYKYETYPVRD
jgi:hypothetical protein